MTRPGQSLRLFLKRLAIATTNGANSIIGDRKQQFLLVRTLGLGLVSVLFILAFALLAGEMLEGDTRAFDMALFGAAQSLQLAHPQFFETMRDFSGLGSTIVLTLVTALTVGYLALVSMRASALLVAVSTISGSICVKILGLVSVLFILAFALLAGEMLEGDTRAFDMALFGAAQSLQLAHPQFFETMRDFSGLGSTIVLTLVTALTVGYLALVSMRASALLVAVSTISGSICVKIFKIAFGRARPDTAYAELVATTLSFPSGHATMSAVVFLTLGALVASTRPLWIERIYILCAAATMTVLVGISRVALGVHWATDVLGGWAFGSAWAIAWLLLAGFLSRRRHRQASKEPSNLL